MRVAIIGSRGLTVDNLGQYLPASTDEIVSGGAEGVDASAAAYAKEHDILLTEIRPDYKRYKKGAPLRRNLEIISRADRVLAFWDGHSRGTLYTIEACRKRCVPIRIFLYIENLWSECHKLPPALTQRLK